MNQPDLSVFIDSNVFLQLRDIKDLDWHDKLDVQGWIEIVVAPVIIGELDKKKVDRNSRLRDRSRAALALIEGASAATGTRIELVARPRLTLHLTNPLVVDWSKTPTLDRTSNDDMLVAVALAYPGNTVLMSHDTGPIIRSRLHGLSAVRAPDEWLLPHQPDEAQQEIQNLKREVLELRNTRPRIGKRRSETTAHFA
jgi:hypothetical protein